MRVGIVGSGYVGTTVAAGLAEIGHDVTNVDIDEAIVQAISEGQAPIHEPGLAELIEDHAGGRLTATTEYEALVDASVVLLCLPTPSREDGLPGLEALEAAVTSLLPVLDRSATDPVVAVKSTVLPGTTADVVESRLAGTGATVAANPEFLRMSTAVEDFFSPEKIVVGATDEVARTRLRSLYQPILDDSEATLVETSIRDAELIKYANNAFLATKLSLVNELGNIAKEYGADAYEVLDAVGLDDRISPAFMRSGLGWGGSCFPKDVDALRAGARAEGYEPVLLDAAVEVNDRQPERLVELLARHVELEGARIAVLGLAFKPHTDDVRGSRALDVVAHLRDRGATVVAYDPVAVEQARERAPAIEYASSALDALSGADGAVLATEWPEFETLTFDKMRQRVVVDGRRVPVDRDGLEVYEGLTW